VSTDWWPASLAHVPKEDPWADDHVVVAEIKSFEDGPKTGQRITVSSLVPVAKLDALRQNLASLSFEVSASGPRPFPSGDGYRPRFWIETHGDLRDRYEPLVLEWTSHNCTVLLPDPGFLMTYGLVPRPAADGAVHWDDLTRPVRDVVCVTKPSLYDSPNSTPASVTIWKPYLQDYLSLRRMALVQSFCEERWSPSDDEIEARLGGEQIVDIDTPGRRMRLFRPPGETRAIMAQASSSRVVAMPGPFPISHSRRQEEGLTWPGINDAVDHARAMGLGMEYVYVDDRVLGDYEGRPEYQVYPQSGAVRFGTQWSVSFCDRFGRDLIRLELKKLYEGVPPAVTRRWNEFAVSPPADTSYASNEKTPNVAKRAKLLTYGLVMLGENLAALARTLSLSNLTADKFVVPRRGDLDYSGWWSFADAEAVARHVPKDATRDAFLERGLALTKLLIEGLRERSLRATLQAAGVPERDIKEFGSLKLLDCVVKLCQMAHATGLRFAPRDSTIWRRLSTEGITPQHPIPLLFALYDMRGLKAHRGEDAAKFAACLARFGIEVVETTAGHGLILDRVYDGLIAEINRTNETIAAALDQ
jgi:hypothetical protein